MQSRFTVSTSQSVNDPFKPSRSKYGDFDDYDEENDEGNEDTAISESE